METSVINDASSMQSLSDSWIQAVQSRIIPNQEFLLQGSILDSAVDQLLQRLKGLCDHIGNSPETFHDLEMCFSLRNVSHTNQPQPPLMIRVRRALDREVPYHVRYVGQSECSAARPTLVRSSIDVTVTPTILEFLSELGCRLDFEYIIRGFLFRKGRMKVTVAKLFKVIPGKQQDVANEPLSQSYLVELSVLAPNGHDNIGTDMRIFADQLKPLVQLEKIDYKRIGISP